MFPILLGFWTAEQIAIFLGLTQSSNNMKYSNYIPDARALQIIKQNESKYGESAPTPKAYIDNAWTIGFGTCWLFDSNGKPVNINGSNGIKPNYTLSYLKQVYKSNQSDYDFAQTLILNHWKQSRYKIVASVLDSLKVPFNVNLAQSLCDASYNHGSIFKGKSWDAQFNLFTVSLTQTNDLRIWAANYLSYRCYYAANAMSNKDWQTFKFGLIRRYYQCALNITGNMVSIDQVRKNTPTLSVLYSKIFQDFGLKLTY